LIDEAFETVDMLSAIDEAFDHFDLHSNINEMFEVANTKKTSFVSMTSIGASVGALLAIGAGFAIKNKFNIVQKSSETESLLWVNPNQDT